MALLVLPLVEAENFGSNLSDWQEPTWKWLEIGAVVPALELPGGAIPVVVPENCWELQLVGLKMKPGRSMTESTRRRSVGTP